MTQRYFVDASFLIALIHPDDAFHEKANAVKASLPDDALLYTTDLILAEFLNFFAKRSKASRERAGLLAELAMSAKSYRVVRLKPEDFNEALRRYRLPRKRRRCAPGLTDIHAMMVMEKRGIENALSGDATYRDEGFNVLLLEEPGHERN